MFILAFAAISTTDLLLTFTGLAIFLSHALREFRRYNPIVIHANCRCAWCITNSTCALTRAITLAIRDDTPQEAKQVNLVIHRKNVSIAKIICIHIHCPRSACGR